MFDGFSFTFHRASEKIENIDSIIILAIHWNKMVLLGSIPKNFKILVLIKASFLRKNQRNFNRVNLSFKWIRPISNENSHYWNYHFREMTQSYLGVIPGNPGIHPKYTFSDILSKWQFRLGNESFEISRYSAIVLVVVYFQDQNNKFFVL